MRIAFCLNGQIRSWKECYETWFKFFEELRLSEKFRNENIDVDVFIHTWDFNTIPPHRWYELGFPKINWAKEYFKIDDQELNEMIEVLKPTKWIIEDSKISETRQEKITERAIRYDNPDGGVINWSAPQLYGIMRSAQLKREYELENEFEYDVCIKMRFDGKFNDIDIGRLVNGFNFPLNDKTIYSMHSANLTRFPHDLVGDIFFYSNSKTYDVLTSLYNWVPIMKQSIFDKDIKIEEVFGYFIRMFDIKNKRSEIDVEIVRQNINI